MLYCVVCEIFGRGGKTYTRVTQEIYDVHHTCMKHGDIE